MNKIHKDLMVALLFLGTAGTGYGYGISLTPFLNYFLTSVFVASGSMWLTLTLVENWKNHDGE